MVIETESPIVAEIVKNQMYHLKYGTLKKGTDAKVKIKFTDCEYYTHKKSCGCTNPTVEIINNGFILTINYDTKKTGTINQYVEVTTDKTKTRFELKGQIIL